MPSEQQDEQSDHQQVPRVLLESNNPLDVTPEDLDEIADYLEQTSPNPSVEIGYDEQYGAGVTGHEVLIFWIPNAEAIRDGIYVALITAATQKFRERFKRKNSERRKKVIRIHDRSTGLEIETWILESETSEPVIRKPNQDSIRRRLPTHRQRGRHRR